MRIIRQDVISKRLLLVNHLDYMRDGFDRLQREVDFRESDEKFNDITNGLFIINLHKRIESTIRNIDYLKLQGYLDKTYAIKLKMEMEDLLSGLNRKREYMEELLAGSRNEYKENRLNIEKFLTESKVLITSIIDTYEEYMYSENQLVEIIMEVWSQELTDCNTYTNGDKYKFLVYATGKSADNVVEHILRNNAVIHTSYITNTHARVYQNRKYGLVFQPNVENLLFMSDEDNMTVDASLFLDKSDFSVDKHYFFKDNGIISVNHSQHSAGRTYIPEQLLGNEYNEVDLINNEYTIPKAVFVFSDANESYEKEAAKLADLLKIGLIKLNRL